MHPEFPLDDEIIYLNHAAVAPWPKRTYEAVELFAKENIIQGAKDYPKWTEKEAELKKLMQWLINAESADDIALLKNTSEGLSVIAHGLNWKKGDNVVIPDQEFPSNRIVWESLKEYGVEVRSVSLKESNSPESALIEAIDNNTRLMSVSAVQYDTGFRLDLSTLGKSCKEQDILFCIDAIQCLGALSFDVQKYQADFVIADGHKWMLGPEGLALFYCSPIARDLLSLKQYGWRMVAEPFNFDNKDWQVAPDARRFECGSPNMLGIFALHASLSLIKETGIDFIEEKILKNSSYLTNYINSNKDYELISSSEPERISGIVTFRHKHIDAEMLYPYLMSKNIICAHRGGGIRFSPHFYTDTSLIDHAMTIIDNYNE